MRPVAFELEHEVAVRASRIAGEILLSHFGSSPLVRHKGEIDLVTDADEAAERAIVAEIQRHFPGDQVLAEEGTAGGSDPDRIWIVDPLDGTTNFAHGYPIFAVSIALEVKGVVEVGVVYQPVLRELFTARRGEGALLNGAPIHVSRAEQLGKSMLCSGFPYARDQIPDALSYWRPLILVAQALRRDGAAAIDLCYVAAGRFDGFWERALQPWDVAAGGLIVAEAGGRLTDYRGGSYDPRGREIVASNGLIHREMLAVMARAT
jgi:myo-inositol-1(or 4)-monophosphatase